MGKHLAARLSLMHYKTFKGKVGKEDRLSIEVANYLRAATLQGLLKATWTHIPHEVGGGGKLAAIRMALAKAMGLIKGSADFVFVWPSGGGWIELKTDEGHLSPEQKDFRLWCEDTGTRYVVCRSLEEVVEKLFSWGVLTTTP